MSAESFVWIDDSQIGSSPTYLSSFLVSIPFSFGDQEIVVNDFTVEVVRRNIEVCRSSVEVEMNSVGFADSSFPRVVILVGIERTNSICPSLVKSFDFTIVFFLSEGKYQIIVLNSSAVSENNLVFARIDFINSNEVRLCVIFTENLSGRR